MRIGPSDRVAVFGETLTGKSTLIDAITRRWDRFLIVDTKGEPALVPPNTAVAHDGAAAARALPGRVYFSPTWSARGLWGEVDVAVRRAYALRGHAIVIHEGYDVCKREDVVPAVGECVVQGAIFGVPMLYAFQNPVGLWRRFFTSASVVIVFYLTSQAHRNLLAYELGVEALARRVPLDHSFLYWRRDDPDVVHHLPPLTGVA